MRETTISLSDGLYINGQHVDCEPYITVTRKGTLIELSTVLYVDITNFEVNEGLTQTNVSVTFENTAAD